MALFVEANPFQLSGAADQGKVQKNGHVCAIPKGSSLSRHSHEGNHVHMILFAILVKLG
jgi:hypothetical protein